MVLTPWGRSDELRHRRLRPGPGATREQVARNQRERLFGAMVAAVAAHGYEKTRVADLVEISGISRNTFYRQFSNKRDCFLATLDALVEGGGGNVLRAYGDRRGGWQERLEAALGGLIEMVLAQPAAARLYYVESYAAGPEAIARVEAMGERLEGAVRAALAESPARARMPRDLLRAVLRGFRRVLQTRLRTGRERDLVAEGPDLLRWALCYETPERPLELPPGAAAPREELVPRDPDDARERILDAVALLVVEDGYEHLAITDIAQRAAISLTTFYAHFDGKDDAVAASLRDGVDRLVAAATPAYRQAPDWPTAMVDGLRALFALLAADPTFARFATVAVHSSGPRAVAARDELLAGSRELLASGYREHPEVSPVVADAIAAAVDALLFDQVRGHGAERLPEVAPTAAYIVLAPFVGAAEACAMATASR